MELSTIAARAERRNVEETSSCSSDVRKTASDAPAARRPARAPNTFASLPNTGFGLAMGTAGQSVLWSTVANTKFTRDVFGRGIHNFLWWAAIVLWAFFFVALHVKAVARPRYLRLEWRHPTRVYFFFMPHLTAILIALATPPSLARALRPVRVFVWVAGFCVQAAFCSVVYGRWMFGDGHEADVGHASPPYLLSTVGWPLLANLYTALHLERTWRLHLAYYLFGAGAVFYGLAFASIMQHLHSLENLRGEPALFLLIAPPAVMSVTLAGFDGGFRGPSQALFGFCLVMLSVLLRLGPRLAHRPDTLGTFWAYVFPPAALATAGIGNAVAEDSAAARGIAWVLVGLASLALAAVFCRTTAHHVQHLQGTDTWDDALLFKANAEDAAGAEDAA